MAFGCSQDGIDSDTEAITAEDADRRYGAWEEPDFFASHDEEDGDNDVSENE